MTKQPSRRDFLKSGLAASAVLMVGAKTTGAGQGFQLFEKSSIGSLELPNRFIKSSTWSGTGDKKGFVTDRTLSFHNEVARGGVGLILTGNQIVMSNGISLPYSIGNYDDSQSEGLKRLVDSVHKEGCKVVVQISHSLARSNPKLFFAEGDELWGVSAVPYSPDSPVPKEMTKAEITRLVEAYDAAAVRSVRCGFDGVMLHGAHGYGLHQFLSPAWNRRGDLYGGSLQNRYRVVGEMMEAMKGTLGPDYPILFKLSAQDFVNGGLEPPEALEIARRLQDGGVAAIQVSACCTASEKDKHCPKTEILEQKDEGYLSDFAQYVKDSVKVPIIAVGGIRSLSTAEGILKDGKADYISLARPLIREPNLINQWKSGNTAKAKCISCNGCFETGMQGLGISCKIERMLKEQRGES
ncbi:MAG TPA: tRNA-dihydrouridine synthase [Desulfomonilaceae bacterium]|nr:tRNA-dihydrouridine synthase [Desulfomonilaceae bacterium]